MTSPAPAASLARDVTTVSAATLASRLLAFIRDSGIAAVLGAGPLSDAFFAALLLPNLFRRLLAEGALNAAFVPVWLRLTGRAGPSRPAWHFAARVALVLFAVLGAIALLGAVFAAEAVALIAPGFGEGARAALAAQFLRLSIAYIALAGPVAVGAAILNAQRRIGAAAAAIVAFNAVSIAAIAFVIAADWQETPRAGAVIALAIVAGGLVQMGLVAAGLRRLARTSAPAPTAAREGGEERIGAFFARALPGVIAAGIPQLVLMAGIMVASSSASAMSWLYYAYRLYELPLGVIAVAISMVLMPLIAASLRAGDDKAARRAQSRALEIGLGLALPAAAALAVLATPITAALFEHGAFTSADTQAVAGILAAIAFALPGHVLEKVFGAVAFGHGDTRTPMRAALCGLAVAVIASLLLFRAFGPVGIAVAVALAGWTGAVLLGLVLARRGWIGLAAGSQARLLRIAAATGAMALALALAAGGLARIAFFEGTTAGRFISVAFLTVFGLALYGAALQALGVLGFAALREAWRRSAPPAS